MSAVMVMPLRRAGFSFSWGLPGLDELSSSGSSQVIQKLILPDVSAKDRLWNAMSYLAQLPAFGAATSTLTMGIQMPASLRKMVDVLMTLPHEDMLEDERLPTDETVRRAARLLLGAAMKMGHEFPPGSPTSDSEGGIRVFWTGPHRKIALTVPRQSSESPSLFQMMGDEYGSTTIESEGGDQLPDCLMWLRGE
jgi:hypothetical protein